MKKCTYCLLTALLLFSMIYFSSKSVQAATTNTEEYQVRDPYYSLSDNSVNRATSEHFQIIWGNKDTTGLVNSEYVQGNLENLEKIRSFYMDEIGFTKDTGSSQNSNITGKYKTNIYIAETGLDKITDDWAYMAVDSDSFGYLVLMPAAMRVDPPSWVLPHELAHAYIFHNGGVVPYYWNESIANFLRNEYLGSNYYSYGGTVYGPTSDFFAPYILNSELRFPHINNWYDSWPIFLYINENSDNINGLGHQAVLNLLTYSKEETTYFKSLENVTGVSIKEILGGVARRMVTMDFKSQKYYLKYLDDLLADSSNSEKIYTTLESGSDGWMTVPDSKAPQQTGYNIIPLTIDLTKASFTVNFQGTSTAKGADWRVSIVTVTKSGKTRYSSMWSNGENSMSLNGDEESAYLVVSATPDTIESLNLEEAGTTYPYKVKIAVSDTALDTENKDTNLATSATASAIINTPDDLGGVTTLNDGYEPSSSADKTHGVWHNWQGDTSAKAWVQYDWATEKVLTGMDAYYFTDGNFAPETVAIEVKDSNGNWVSVTNASGLGTRLNKFNYTSFDPVSTKAIRMYMTPKTLGCGVIEWKVYGH